VYIAADELPEMSLEEDGYAALVGWTVLSPAAEDGEFYEIGEISDFMDIPNNPCIEVETENGAVILPLHEDFILAIDPEYQEIVLQIPEGLL
jgi:ribosomal 30S subunit maturation factor RimM